MSGVFYTWICTAGTGRDFKNPGDVLLRAMSSVHDRLAECEQRNGGHLEDVIFGVE